MSDESDRLKAYNVNKGTIRHNKPETVKGTPVKGSEQEKSGPP